MTVLNPAFRIPRQSVAGSEGLWTKMFDPPRLGPPTPEQLNLTNLPPGVKPNPVPSVMQAMTPKLYKPGAAFTVNRDLMHGIAYPTWDGGVQTGSGAVNLEWYLFEDKWLNGNVVNPQTGATENANASQYPGPTYRAPRGAICHNFTATGGPPPHTIHWHGIEPTPMNDGVGHCSFEVTGSYIYQWQPNFIGTYFYHCHRNTMMHFEYGLAGFMLFSPPDAWFASIATLDPITGIATLNSIPIGHGRPEPANESDAGEAVSGRFRTAANLNFSGLPHFPGFVGGNPILGPATPDPQGLLQFDPHAFTVPYDVECLWMMDDRSSQWSQGTKAAFQTMPVGAGVGGPAVYPGYNEGFHNDGKVLTPTPGNDFFGFNDFNADYWFVTGVPVTAVKGRLTRGTDNTLPTGLVYPAVLNGGISGSRIDILAGVNQTVFIRCLCAAYNSVRTTFPVDVVIIEWDGRALGVPPLNRYTRPILVKAGHPIVHSTARRWGLILNSPTPVQNFVKVEFLDTRSGDGMSLTGGGDVLIAAYIPINIV